MTTNRTLVGVCVALLGACSPAPRTETPKPSITAAGEAPPAVPAEPKGEPAGVGTVLRLDPALMDLIPAGAIIEKAASGFQFTEGPLYFKESANLWFSDVQGNVVRQLSKDGVVTEILRPAGYDGVDAPAGAFIGPNGMILDKIGNVLICQHGNRRIARRSPAGVVTTLVDRFEGKKLNSPNDLVFKSDGALYFTDPPYGLDKQDDDPKKELPFNGVFRLKDGKLTLLTKDLTRPNGLAFSPDERWLYVANSDESRKVWMKYPVNEDGLLGPGRLFAAAKTAKPMAGLPDGLRVDTAGNVWATGPGGIWIFNSEGKQLGAIRPPEVPANLTFADDGAVLWMTAQTSLYRMKLK